MKSFGKIALCLAGGLAVSVGLRADDLAANSNPLPDNPYAPIVARNVFGLNPPPPPSDNTIAPPAKITPSGIQNFLGQLQVLFKVSGVSKPGQPAKDEFYTLSEGQREDDIEVVSIDDKNGIITFNNHGVLQVLPLVVGTAIGGSSSPLPNPSDFTAPNNGNENNGGGRGFGRFGRRGGGFNGGGNNGGDNGNADANGDSNLRTVPSRTYQPESTQMTPEEAAILIEQHRAELLDNPNPPYSPKLIPPTPLTPAVTGEQQ